VKLTQASTLKTTTNLYKEDKTQSVGRDAEQTVNYSNQPVKADNKRHQFPVEDKLQGQNNCCPMWHYNLQVGNSDLFAKYCLTTPYALRLGHCLQAHMTLKLITHLGSPFFCNSGISRTSPFQQYMFSGTFQHNTNVKQGHSIVIVHHNSNLPIQSSYCL